MVLKMTIKDLAAFMVADFPQLAPDFTVEAAAPMQLTLRLNVMERHLRPGGTVSGPSIFALADVGGYLAVLSMIGPEALAVTTNCSFDFMRKPAADIDLLAEVRLLKLGRVLAVADVLIYSEGVEAPVARASLTYSIPPSPRS